MEGETVNGDDTISEELLPPDARRYTRAAFIIDNENKASKSLYILSAFAVFID